MFGRTHITLMEGILASHINVLIPKGLHIVRDSQKMTPPAMEVTTPYYFSSLWIGILSICFEREPIIKKSEKSTVLAHRFILLLLAFYLPNVSLKKEKRENHQRDGLAVTWCR